MVHSEQEVVDALIDQFEDNMKIDEDDIDMTDHKCTNTAQMIPNAQSSQIQVKPVFVSRKDRVTINKQPEEEKKTHDGDDVPMDGQSDSSAVKQVNFGKPKRRGIKMTAKQ